MHLLKPSWLAHKDENRRFEIYSLSVSPDGNRLATGGLDGKIRIWSTETIYAADKEAEDTKHRQLCSMSNHNGAVTVVRFSPNGKYLASGSDDRVVLIWEFDETRAPRKEFGNSNEQDQEAWVARRRLIGHENDVQDLAWSPDSSLLVTVGLDSSIIIWSGTTFEKIKRFDAHQSHVKGITFDPANKYFATASDDRTVRIIRYHRGSGNEITFSIEATISTPFKDSPLSTYFRRCSWSPDGSHIAAANATNGPVTTVSIINRGTWESDISLIGHEAPCEVASFCPAIFSTEDYSKLTAEQKEELNNITVVATAGQDKALAIWNTQSPRPLLVAQNVADKAISDLAWSPDGDKLFASSLDGTVLVAIFEPNELGYKLPAEASNMQLTRYGGRKDEMQIPETVEQIELEERIGEKDSKDSVKLMDQIMGNDATGVTVNGLPGEQPGKPVNVIPTGATISTTTNSITTTTPIPSNGFSQAAKNSQTNAATPLSPAKPAVQKVTITKDGKKRITPQLISSTSNAPSSSSTSALSATTATRTTTAGGQVLAQGSIHAKPVESNIQALEVSKPSNALPSGGIQSLVIGTKRKRTDDDDVSSGANANSNSNGVVHVDEDSLRKKTLEVPEFFKSAVVTPASAVAQVRLAVPKVRTFFSRSVQGQDGVVLEIRNGTSVDREPTRVVAIRQDQVLFIDFLPAYGHLAAGDAAKFWAVATEDGVIYTYSPTGRRLMPSIVLGSPLTFLESQGSYLLAISSVGMVYVWNVSEQRAAHSPVSLAPVLDTGIKYSENGLVKGPSVTQCGVTNEGKIIVTLTNGDAYTYNNEMFVWQRLSEPWWAYGSQYWDSLGVVNLREGSDGVKQLNGRAPGLISMLEQRTNEEVMLKPGSRGRQLQRMAKNRMMQEGYEGFEGVVSISHLENRIAAAVVLHSKAELENMLIMYAKRIAEESLKERLDELCRDLLGPTLADPTAGHESWSPTVCGLDKHELLRSILTAVGKYREVQAVIREYAQVIGLV